MISVERGSRIEENDDKGLIKYKKRESDGDRERVMGWGEVMQLGYWRKIGGICWVYPNTG